MGHNVEVRGCGDPLDVGRMADIISNRDKLAEGIAGMAVAYKMLEALF